MLGLISKIMSRKNQLIKHLFGGGDEVKRKMSKGIAQVILEDMITLYREYYMASGAGILVFNMDQPGQSRYITMADILADKAVAEEMLDEETAAFLAKAANIVEKEEDRNTAVIMLVESGCTNLQVHVIDLEEAADAIEQIAEDAPRII
jgi:hypothetical protein